WGWTAAVHPDDVDQLTDVWRRVLKAGVRGEAEARLRRSDGEYRWFLFTAEPLHDESGAVIGWGRISTSPNSGRRKRGPKRANTSCRSLSRQSQRSSGPRRRPAGSST